MDSDNLIGVIELGGVNIRCVIFSVSSENVSEILSSSIIKSEGIHNSKIVNFSKKNLIPIPNIISSCVIQPVQSHTLSRK